MLYYIAPDQETLDHYQANFAPALQKDHTDRFLGKFAAFRTTLSVVKSFKK